MTRDLPTPPVLPSGSLSDSPQPVLSSAQGLVLRPWRPTDAATFLSACQDEEIQRWHTRRPSCETRVLEWFARCRQAWEQDRGGHRAVTHDGSEVLGRIAMGSVNLDRLHLDHSTRNHASCRVATKSGHQPAGTMRSAGLHDDGRHDMHLHAKARDV